MHDEWFVKDLHGQVGEIPKIILFFGEMLRFWTLTPIWVRNQIGVINETCHIALFSHEKNTRAVSFYLQLKRRFKCFCSQPPQDYKIHIQASKYTILYHTHEHELHSFSPLKNKWTHCMRTLNQSLYKWSNIQPELTTKEPHFSTFINQVHFSSSVTMLLVVIYWGKKL